MDMHPTADLCISQLVGQRSDGKNPSSMVGY